MVVVTKATQAEVGQGMAFSRQSKREYVLAALEKYERHLTRYAARMLGGDVDSASDVVQFAYLKLCQQDDFKRDGQLKAWLYAVCRNRTIDLIRKNGRLSSVESAQLDLSEGGSVDPRLDAERREWFSELRMRIDQLPAVDREIIDLWSHGLKHQEIAEITDKKASTVRVQLHRLIKSLKREMGVESVTESH